MEIIDSNILFGTDHKRDLAMNIDHILGVMDSKGISRGILANYKCKFYDYVEGNNQLAEVCSQYPQRFTGFAAVNPSEALGCLGELDRVHRVLGLRGIRIFNTFSGFFTCWGNGFDGLVLMELYERAQSLGLPVFIEAGAAFKDLVKICESFPRLSLIASGTGYGNLSEALAALKRCENLYIETSCLDAMDGIETLVRHSSAERIVFGSGLPYNAASSALMMIHYAKISDKEKEKIFGGNIRRILEDRLC